MKILLLILTLALTGCSEKWKDFNYGPAEWLAEKFPSLTDGKGLEISTSSYEWLENPTVNVHVTEDLSEICGTVHTDGCHITDTFVCDIYVGERASISTMNHELRHCRGWSHREPESRTNAVQATIKWYPTR
jgi:hypothetical protein